MFFYSLLLGTLLEQGRHTFCDVGVIDSGRMEMNLGDFFLNF